MIGVSRFCASDHVSVLAERDNALLLRVKCDGHPWDYCELHFFTKPRRRGADVRRLKICMKIARGGTLSSEQRVYAANTARSNNALSIDDVRAVLCS